MSTDATASAYDRAVGRIDMFSPLLRQIPVLSHEEYLAWVHEPFSYAAANAEIAAASSGPGSETVEGRAGQAAGSGSAEQEVRKEVKPVQKAPRLFVSDAMERLSFTAWWAIPMVWVPVAAALWAPYIRDASFSLQGAALALGVGLSLWTLIEYSIHRGLFHIDSALPAHPLAHTLHFLLHGVHHKVPMDPGRLVMPPALFAILCLPVYFFFRTVLAFIPLPVFHAMYGSGILGYVAYDMMHYSQHHARFPPDSYLGRMKRYHMRHHFAGLHNVAYGITSTFWDQVFGTLPPAGKE